MTAATATKLPKTAIVAVAVGLKASAVVELNLDEVATFANGTEEKLSNEVGALVMRVVEAEVVCALVCSTNSAATK